MKMTEILFTKFALFLDWVSGIIVKFIITIVELLYFGYVITRGHHISQFADASEQAYFGLAIANG